MKSTLSGALAALGTFLFGVPYMLNTVSPDFPKAFSIWCMGIGIACTGAGIFFTALFAADAKHVKEIGTQVKANTDQIAVTREAVRSGVPESIPTNPT